MKSLHAFLLGLFLIAPCGALPQGEFLLGEYDGERFLYRVSIQGHRMTVTPTEEKEDLQAYEVELKRTQARTYRFQIPGSPEPLSLVELNDEEFLWVSTTGEIAVRKGIKVVDFPNWMLGEWQEASGESVLTITKNQLSVRDKGKLHEAPLLALAPSGPMARVVVLEKDARSFLLNAFSVEHNILLLWDEDDGDQKAFHRKGWMK